MKSTLTFCLSVILFSIVAINAEPTLDLKHGRLFPRLLSDLEVELLVERELNLTLGLGIDLDINLNLLRKRQSNSPLTPTQLRTIYNVPGGANAGAGKTVAIVIAYGGSTAEKDLAAFSSKYGLPSCTTANGCFKKYDQNGGTNIPQDDPTTPIYNSWAGEMNLDIQTVHSVAPQAKIIVVCANSASSADLWPAIKTASTLADIVSMSFGSSEGTQAQTTLETTLKTGTTNGVSFFASTGDDGNNAGYPASSSYTIAVGGTTTQTSSGGAYTESAWSGSSGGCSAVYNMNSAQAANSAAVSACGSKRATPDISFDADPNTGVLVNINGTYYQFGGTSLACPISSSRTAAVKAAYASITKIDAAYLYSSKAQIRDVTSGKNTNYNAVAGYDRATGLGVWGGDNVPTTSSTTAAAATTKSTTAAAAPSATKSTTRATTSSTTSTTAAPPATQCSGLLCLKRFA